MLKRLIKRSLLRMRERRIPASRRISGPLVKDGGAPVRNPAMRPWATVELGSAAQWNREVGALLKEVYVRGEEGLPLTRARAFEKRWAEYTKARFALLVGHGTDALRIGLAAALDHDGLEYGGEVIVPNYSFIATATAALDRRFGVAFVDVDPHTLLVDPRRIEEAIIPGKTRAILPVHLFGQPADMTAITDIARRHGLKVIEDAAQAHGAVWETGPVGSLGDVGAFSFQSSKNLSCGEGGALVTSDEEILERAYAMYNVGRSRAAPDRWAHLDLGWNCRPTEYQAVLLNHRLTLLDGQQERRQRNAELLRRHMADLDCVEPLRVQEGVRAHGMYMFAMRYRAESCDGLAAEAFLEHARAEGAPLVAAFSLTLSGQPAFQKLMKKHPEYFRCLETPVADQATTDTFYIPSNVFLGRPADMEDIFQAMKKVERHFSGGGS